VALEHQALLAERAATHATSKNDSSTAVALANEAQSAREQAQVLRDLLLSKPLPKASRTIGS
jgi:hypothetical protein